jgi:hypothetical protein
MRPASVYLSQRGMTGRGCAAAAFGRDAAGFPADVAGRFRDAAGFFRDPVPDFATLLL